MYKYIILCAWVFCLLDWKMIQLTRFTHREWMDWMHAHERQYAAVVYPLEIFLCTPAFALKPIFMDAVVQVEATPEQLQSITHAPRPDLKGFYRPVERGVYQFMPWSLWFLYWLAPSLLWMWLWIVHFKR